MKKWLLLVLRNTINEKCNNITSECIIGIIEMYYKIKQFYLQTVEIYSMIEKLSERLWLKVCNWVSLCVTTNVFFCLYKIIYSFNRPVLQSPTLLCLNKAQISNSSSSFGFTSRFFTSSTALLNCYKHKKICILVNLIYTFPYIYSIKINLIVDILITRAILQIKVGSCLPITRRIT